MQLERQAQKIARHWVESDNLIDGICLYGSVARGESERWSDIDLLVFGRRSSCRPSELLNALPTGVDRTRVSVVYRPSQSLDEYFGEGTRFLVHIHREGKVLYDRDGRLRAALRSPCHPVPAEREIQQELERLEFFADPDRFNGGFLLCFARVYTIAKTIVMAILTEKGVYEFNRDRAFDQFKKMFPAASEPVEVVQRLRPFYGIVADKQREKLPFSYLGTATELEQAVAATRALAAVATNSPRT